MLTLFGQVIVVLGTFAPAPEPPAPKKLDRVPDTSPELRKELNKFDTEYRNGTEEKFAELEKLADELAKRFTERNDRARIWYGLADVAGQSGIDRHAGRVKKYADKCLAISRDPLQRGRMWSILASAVDLNGTAFHKGRREAAEILLTGYVEMLAQELPEEAPELPRVDRFDIDGDPVAENRARAQHAAQMAARQEAEFTRALVDRRDILVLQLRDLFKPEPKRHGRNPEGPDELRELATKKKMTEQQVNALMEKVTK
jgi:hypothetical protein